MDKQTRAKIQDLRSDLRGRASAAREASGSESLLEKKAAYLGQALAYDDSANALAYLDVY